MFPPIRPPKLYSSSTGLFDISNFESSNVPSRQEMLDQALGYLVEHFDSVQIVATSRDEGETNIHFNGRGNWYARLGSVKAFIEHSDEFDREQARSRNDEEEDFC